MAWHSAIAGFKAYLKLERSLSDNSISNYLRDVGKLDNYFHQILEIEKPLVLYQLMIYRVLLNG